jgi:hypothetical protein
MLFFNVGTPKESIFFGPLSMAYISSIITHIFTNYISFMISTICGQLFVVKCKILQEIQVNLCKWEGDLQGLFLRARLSIFIVLAFGIAVSPIYHLCSCPNTPKIGA